MRLNDNVSLVFGSRKTPSPPLSLTMPRPYHHVAMQGTVGIYS